MVSAEDASAAWERARQWIAKHGDLPLQVSDETILQTQAGTDEYDARTQLTVTREKLEDGSWQFDVRAFNKNMFGKSRMWASARALAYFVSSGIRYPE